jgi:hypothetical protein
MTGTKAALSLTMKNTNKGPSVDSNSIMKHDLFEQIRLLLDSDLEDPAIGRYALKILKIARKKGIKFQDPSDGCPECAACLFFALMSAESSERLH